MTVRDQVISQKKTKVDDLTEQFKSSDALFFTEYRGLSVQQLQEFRHSLRESNASYVVIKNTLT